MSIKYASLFTVLFALLLVSCRQSKEDAALQSDTTASEPVYSALDAGSGADWENDPQLSALVGKFPRMYLIEGSFDFSARGFLGIESVDRVITARYVVGSDSLTLFLTDDRSGRKYLRFTEFAAQQSQVWPASEEIDFDEGYSAVFQHRELKRVLGGLKSGHLLGAVSYRDSSLDFISRWVKAVE